METLTHPKISGEPQPLSGAVVLVKSTRDRGNPPTALRGTVEVYQTEGERPPVVAIALDYPQMFNTPAHRRTITLTEAETAELIASENAGAYQITLDVDLSPNA